MFKKWFTKQEDKDVWDILDYYVPAEKYRQQCERLTAYGNKDSLFPPAKLNKGDDKKLKCKQEIQWYSNYVESLKIYNEFTGKSETEILLYEAYINTRNVELGHYH